MANIMNIIKRNPRTSTVAGVFLIALIAVIVWLVTRGGNDNDKNEEVDGKPEIEIIGASKTIKPIDEVEATETYENYTTRELAKQIDFTIRWNNKGGVESINKLIFVRTNAAGAAVQRTEISKGSESYFIPFSKGNSFTFTGDLAADVELLGQNRLQMLYVLNDSTTETEIFDSNTAFTGATNRIEITQEDLKIAEISDEVQSVTYTPTTGTFSISKITPNEVYYLYPGGSEFNSFDIHSAIVGITGGITFIPAQTAGSGNTFHIYLKDVKKYVGSKPKCPKGWIEFGGNCVNGKCTWPNMEKGPDLNCTKADSSPNMTYMDQLIDVTNMSDAKEFRITNTPGIANKYRIQDVVSSRFLGMDDNKAVLININDDRVTEKLYATIDLEILEAAKSGECLTGPITWSECGPGVTMQYPTRTILQNTAACKSLPPLPASKSCPKDAVCEFSWTPCPVTCGGVDTMQEILRVMQHEAPIGGGKTCEAQTPGPRPCGRNQCKVGRTCYATPTGKIVNASDCTNVHPGRGCEWDALDYECSGPTYQKVCDRGVRAGESGCELQQTFYVTDDPEEPSELKTIDILLGTVPVLE